MENKIFLQRYRLSLGRNGLPVELHRSPAARTFRAQERETGREVALSLVSPLPDDLAVLERLERQADAAERINHLNVPRLYDFGWEDDVLIYVHEYCEGPTAAAWVGARGPLALGAVLRVAVQVVDAMSATAFQRLYHPALNPENILFVAGQTREGDWPPIKVLEWFIPPLALGGESEMSSAARFASPEQIRDGQIDVRSEIYSLGATMLFLLTGVAPAADGAETAVGKLRGTPKIVRHLLGRMLRAEPNERPQDPVALAAYLQTCLARNERREKINRRFALPVTTRPRMVEKRKSLPWPIKPLALAAAFLALAALAVLFLPWPGGRNVSGRAVQTEGQRETELADDSFPVVQKASLGRLSDGSRDIMADAPSPQPQAGESEMRSEEFASTAETEKPGANPPAEGPAIIPSAPSPAIAAASPTEEVTEASSPNEPSDETNQPHEAIAIATPAAAPDIETAESAETQAPSTAGYAIEPPSLPNEQIPSPPPNSDEPEQAVAVATPAPAPLVQETPSPAVAANAEGSPAEHAPTPSARRPRKHSKAVARLTKKHSAKVHRVAHRVKRARPIPKLHVGSARAELVGTTADGRWILSVADSGRRIIVPPPPGYER